MNRWLAIAEWLCGGRARRTIFEPLVADWQRDVNDVRRHGGWRYAQSMVSGSGAFLRSLAWCAVTSGGWLPTSRASRSGVLAFWLAAQAAAAVLLVAALASRRTVAVQSVQIQALLLHFAPIIATPALLPALFVMRRDQRSTARHAIAAITLGAVFTGGVVTLATPEAIDRYVMSFESVEREYQRNVENDRAGRYQYPGTAIRQLRGSSTIEQRRAQYERFLAWRAQYHAKQPPLTWPQLVRRYQPVAFAVIFGTIGWTLAGLGAPSVRRAALWWGLMYMALLAFGGTPTLLTGVPFATRIPDWTALPLLSVIAAALVIASWRQRPRDARV